MIKDIPGYEGMYAVDDSGNVYSYKWGKCKMLKPGLRSKGYCMVVLYKDKAAKTFDVHRLVAQAFLPNFEEGLQVDHIDKNKLNNNLSNLRMVTHQENSFNTNAKGYYFNKSAKKFLVRIRLDYKSIHLGYFDTEEDARAAYLKAKEVYHIMPS